MDEPILEVNHLCKNFTSGRTGTIPAVHDVSFHVRQGECLGIVGESGCGKSTIARLITRLTPADSGEIILNGTPYTASRKDDRKIFRNVQMVFQDPYSVFSPRTSVATFLEDGLVYYHLMSRAEASEEAKRLVRMVDLSEDLLNRFPHQLSGGQLQRIVIARAISIHPDLIILDEATSALDVSVQKQVLELLVRLQKEQHLTYIFIGHDLAVVRSIADRIHVMYAGSIVEKLMAEDLDKAVHPYTRKLLDSVFSVHDRNRKTIQLETLSLSDAGYEKEGCQYRRRCPYANEQCAAAVPSLSPVKPSASHENASGEHQVACFHPLT